MQNSHCFVKKLKFLLIAAAIFSQAICVFSQAEKNPFEQKIQWEKDENASGYNIEIRNLRTGENYTFETEENFINLNFPAGVYEYRITVLNSFGRAQNTSEWNSFEILQVKTPEIVKTQEKSVVPSAKNEKLSIEVDIKNVNEDSRVSLVNEKTNQVVKGELVLQKSADGTKALKAEFPKVESGEWKLRIENPLGRKTESNSIDIVDQKTEEARIAAEKAEAERKKAEQERLAKIEEEKRIAEEARIKAEEEEKARLAAIAKAEEEKRLAEEQRIQKEKEEIAKKQEEERLAAEKAEGERKKAEQERLARWNETPEKHLESKKNPSKTKRIFGFYTAAEGGIFFSPFFTEFSDGKILPFAGVKIGFVPELKKSNCFGFEFDALVSKYSLKTSDYDYSDKFGFLRANILFHRKILKNILKLNFHLGGNLMLIQNFMDYKDSENIKKDALYGYAGVQGGTSLVFTAKNVIAEVGADYNYVFIDGMPTDFFSPCVSVGFRW